MTIKYYIDKNNNYVGAFDSGSNKKHRLVPAGAIEVAFPPDDARQKWNGAGYDVAPVTDAEIDALLIENDMKAIRGLREYIAAQADAPQVVKDNEAAAVALRGSKSA